MTVQSYHPLSENQYGLWLLQTLNPTMYAYNIASVFRISTPLDGAALQRALQRVVCHHPLLRTTFVLQDNHPVQCVHAELAPLFEQVDGADLTEEALQRVVQAAHDRPFDLSTGPLVRLTLFRCAGDDQVLLFNSHHILLDFKSQAQITQELLAAYQSEIAQTSPHPSPIQKEEGANYSEFVGWQQAFLTSQQSERHQRYWREQLQAPLPVLTLPTNRPYPPQQSYQGASLPICLSGDLTQGVLRLAEQKTVTPFIVLLAAYTLLLARYSRQEELIVGIASSERLRAPQRFQQTLGHLVNLLPMRFTLPSDVTFVELLQQTQKVVMGGLFYQNYPFAYMVRDAQSKRDPSRPPLFEASFNMPTLDTANELVPLLTGSPANHIRSMIVQGLPIAPYPLQQLVAQVPLHLDLWQQGEQLVGYFKYNTDLFDKATIARLAGHFEVLLQGIVAHPEQPVWQLPLLTETEYQQIVHEWNDTTVDFGPPQTIHTLFEQQVERTPDAIAVIMAGDKETKRLRDFVVSPQSNDWAIDPHAIQSPNLSISQSLTYAELNARANQLAHHLIDLGVGGPLGADTLVAVAMERSIEMVVALLAVLKAGGAYVPIDPTYPQERIRFMLTDSAAPILLTQSYLPLAQEGAYPIQHRITVDEMLAQWAGQSIHNPRTATLPTDLAYVIYTSGSTGQPKGAANQHDGVFNRLRWTQQQFQLTTGDRVLQKTPFSFDVSVWEFFWTLMSGACLVVAQPEAHKDPAYLREVIHQQQITLLHFVPSMLRQFIASAPVQPVASLRAILTSGEALPLELAQATQRLFPNVPLHNLYGPTEAAVDVSHWMYHNGAPTIPIGKPIANTTLYVLDDSGTLLPIGVAGELYIGGVQLARGYLNRPELTAERFIAHPVFGRLYKTGDLCRWLPDGNIEYLGRTDFQVKIRGFRIELGEIESALLTQDGVREAVVLAREDTPDNKRLVAYLVGEVDLERLRLGLAQRLPDYMIPAAFVRLDALPLTPNGKLDRKALPTPDYADVQTFFVAPRSAQEAQLAAIWEDVLQRERVGVNDNFFALGGDSILSIQVIAKAQQAGIALSLQQLFQHQTIAALAHPGELTQETLPPNTAFALLNETDRQQIPAEIEDAYPLSALQAGMVFHSELNPESAVYHDIFSYHLQAPFAEEALRQAVQAVAARHSTLRTHFVFTGYSEPLQMVQQRVIVPLAMVDLRGLTAPEQEERLKAWMEDEKQRPFVWQQAPLLRLQIHRRTDEQFNLTLSFHHAILDGWSVASLLTELLQHYFACLGYAFTPPAPPLAFYHQFVALERAILADDACRRYWQTTLQDPSIIQVPRWPQVVSCPDNPGAERLSRSLSPELSKGLHQLARQASVPIKSVLLAAHLNVLRVLSNQSDIMTGLVSNGRPESADGERILGLFLNTLPFRLSLQDCSWLELIQQVFAHERHLLPFRRYPLATIQQMQGGTPLFETAFNFVNFHLYERLTDIAGLTMLGGQFFEQTNFALTANFHLDQRSGEIGLALSYNPQEFCAEQIETILAYYETSLQAMSRTPTANYRTNSLLSEREYRQIVHQWNNTAIDFGPPQTIHALFEQQVARTPDAVAVVMADNQRLESGEWRVSDNQSPSLPGQASNLQSLTYAELNARTNQLAHHLIELGVKPDTLVAVAVERSIEMVVSLLAVLKAGGAYLPIDPTYPQERIAFMLADSAAPILLTQSHLLLTQEAVQTIQHLITVNTMSTQWAGQSTHNPQTATVSSDLAYVIYTSGSTGLPKGVMNAHLGVCNLLSDLQAKLSLTNLDRTLQTTVFGFDVATAEIFWPLLNGASLVLTKPDGQRDSSYLVDMIQHYQITTLHLVPTLLQLLVEEPGFERCASLKRLIVAGEALPFALQQRFFTSMKTALHNWYGPTETAIYVTAWQCQPESQRLLVPIGRPVANTQAYVLDALLQPVPIGVAGELYIGGIQVGRGYLHRSDLTAERFIDHPDWGRLYKTGDLCRWLPDGNIEYIGRSDFQVKIRGFRIELGEIESALLAQEGVREAVVLAREDVRGDKRLVAYLVRSQESRDFGLLTARLRQALAQRLPEYTIPSAFVQLDALPLTPNGKLDRRALSAPEYSDSQSEYVAPRSEIERVVARIWGEVLNVGQVGVYDNFFAIGGHSLLATQVISRLRSQLQVEIPLKRLFEAPQLAAFAQAISTASPSTNQAAIQPVERSEQIPLSFAQQRLWFLETLGSQAAYNMPVVLEIVGKLEIAALQATLTEIVRRHESLRTTFANNEGTPCQIIQPPLPFVLPVVDLRTRAGESQSDEIKRLRQQEALQPFDLQHDLLLRAQVLQLTDDHFLLLLTMHHIASDGWSIGVLVKEIATLYAAFSQGQPSPLPELAIQYADFALWQRDYLQGEVLERQLSYWQQQLAGAPPLLQLPTDSPRPAQQSFAGAMVKRTIDASLTQALRHLSQQEGTTLYMTLLAAFQILMARYSGQQDVVVGSPIANRHRQELEPLIGFFVNTLALRCNLSDNPNFLTLLAQVKATTQAAYDHQDLPFERLVEALAPERNLQHNPLVQVMFALQNAPMGAFQLPGLQVKMAEFEVQSTRVDLEIHCWEVADGLQLYALYNSDLFQPATLQRLLGHFQTLLAGIVANPTQSVATLPLLTQAERQQLLVDWNNTATDYPKDKTIHQLFEEQAERTPDAVAIVFAKEQLTYAELNARANQLAHYLQSLGVVPERLVGICVERSIEMVVGLLAILKAGGAYLPLDPSYPPERLNFILQDAQPAVLLTQSHLHNHLPILGHRIASTQLVICDEEEGAFAQWSDKNPPNRGQADQLAYVIYTSGSTGQPKGVLVEHRGLANIVMAQSMHFALKAGDRVLQFSSLNFDAAFFEICAAFFVGATLYLGARESLFPGEPLQNFLSDQQISFATLTPSTLAATPVIPLPALQTLTVAGEACPAEVVQQWGKGRNFFNLYGPTEATIWSTVHRCTDPSRCPPIGRPIANTQSYLLDPHCQPVPIGVAGELYLGGVGIARGYLNRPTLTSERFIQHPEWGRLYKTGDLGRWLSDGNIEFLGRIDQQVKIRGYRIELGEIEATVSQHPAIQEAVVIAREDEPGEKRLVAYLVADPADAETQQEHVTTWQNLYEESYSQPAIQAALNLNLTGWNSSYTGQPIPADEMMEWIDNTVAEIRSLQPQRVLEIGCGTGLLLSRLAAACEVYYGVDYSQQALDHVARLRAADPRLAHVQLAQRMADDFHGLDERSFDCIILNSVVQYFPSVDYLLKVLTGAVRLLKPGGTIYVGDVRNYQLLEAYHASVQLFQAEETLSLGKLQTRIQQRLQDEEELLIDPAFFQALPSYLPQITDVQLHLKRGMAHNELTRFRYQVILHVGDGSSAAPSTSPPAYPEVIWQTIQDSPNDNPADSLTTLRSLLLRSDSATMLRSDSATMLRSDSATMQNTPTTGGIIVRGIPDARLQQEAYTLHALVENRLATVGQVRQQLSHPSPQRMPTIEPEALWQLAEQLGYQVTVSSSAQPGQMDALFTHTHLTNERLPARLSPTSHKPWQQYTNNPLLGKLSRTLTPKVRTFLQGKLPEYMIPNAFVMLEKLPLTPNGKVDCKALPAPNLLRRSVEGTFTPPRTPTERTVADIWSSLLTIEQIGIHDSFFDLGGHSLLATQVISRIRHIFAIDLPLRSLFETMSVMGLAQRIEEIKLAASLHSSTNRTEEREEFAL